MTAYEFICERGGMQIKLSSGKIVTVLEKDNYEKLIKRLYKPGSFKYKNLMSYDIPESFIERQLNDTRYITRTIRGLLAPVVRKEEEEATIPKGIITMPGQITNKLKRDWGLNQIWQEIVAPRFIRLNKITKTDDYYEKSPDGRSFVLKNHDGLKRIDHRHHALDALIVACTTISHITYLNTLHNEKKSYAYAVKLLEKDRERKFLKPWPSFTQDTRKSIQTAIVTFKSINRVITRGNNYTFQWINENGVKKKKHVKQKKSQNLWSIRQPLHKETVSGKILLRQYQNRSLFNALKEPERIADPDIRKHVKSLFKQYEGDLSSVRKHLQKNPLTRDGRTLQKIKLFKMETFTASRQALDKTFTKKKIEKVADKNIRKILLNHLDNYGDNPEEAFSPEGLETMNSKLKIPIYKVRCFESIGKKFSLGNIGNKKSKYVEAAKGTNLFFVIYEKENGERLINSDSSLVLADVIERKKQKLPLANNIDGYRWFLLSPGDIVYMPEPEENVTMINWNNLDAPQIEKLYKCVSFSRGDCYFIPLNVSDIIEDKKEYGLLNKTERDFYGRMIKKHCIKLNVTRLGDIQPARYDSNKQSEYI